MTPLAPVRMAGALVLSLLLVQCGPDAEEVGSLPPVYPAPAELTEVRELGRGQTFGEILSEMSLEGVDQRAVLLAFREQGDPRRMRAGTEIMVRRRKSDMWLRGLDVALDADRTVRLVRDELGWSSTLVETPVWTDTIYAGGEIESDLWTAVVQSDALELIPRVDRPRILHHLDEVFQWQVDFSRQIQRGDYYRVAFERQVRPDGTMRSGHVIAAELVNVGKSLQAYWFDPNGDGKGTYYDEDGKSVRRAFLRKPLEFRRISSRVSSARFHPILKRWRAHTGVDYAANAGTPVMATGNGVVVQRGPNGGYGNYVEIRHANGFTTRYAHLSRYASGISVGKRVSQGEVIGFVGMTGLATAPHLHYELRQNGRVKDPLSIQLPAGDPVPTDELERWRDQMTLRRALLERLPAAPVLRVASSGVAAEAEDPDSEGGP